MAVLESRWKPNLTEEEGKKLVRDAIHAGIFNDLGSGSNIDLCVIRKSGTEYLRTYEEANIRGKRQFEYRYPKGTTAILTTSSVPIEIEEVVRKVDIPAPMEM